MRTWTCAACGSAHDRDSNAAKNILAATQAKRLNACGVKSKSSLLVSDPEAGTRRKGIPAGYGEEDVNELEVITLW